MKGLSRGEGRYRQSLREIVTHGLSMLMKGTVRNEKVCPRLWANSAHMREVGQVDFTFV